MQQLTKDLTQKLKEQPSKTKNKNKLVEKDFELQFQKTEKETSQAEKLLEDQLEVGPTVQCGLHFQSKKSPFRLEIVRVQYSPKDVLCSLSQLLKKQFKEEVRIHEESYKFLQNRHEVGTAINNI